MPAEKYSTGGYGAPNAAPKYIVQQPHASAPNAQALNAFSVGTILKVIAAGVLAAAVGGTDYVAPGGVAGGQTVTGGTGSGENLTLASTAHATKGKVYLGANQKVWLDGTNDTFSVDNATNLNAVALQIAGDPNTGFMRSTDGADSLSVVCGGGEVVRYNIVGAASAVQFFGNVVVTSAKALFTSTINGATTASATLAISSTTNATKGTVTVGGATTLVVDEVNTRVYIGTASPASTGRLVVEDPGTAINLVTLRATSASGSTVLAVRSSAALVSQIHVDGGSVAGTLFGVTRANALFIRLSTSGSALVVGTDGAQDVVLGSNNVERARILGTGEFVHSSTVAGSTSASGTLLLSSTTNATKGQVQFGGSTGFSYDETNKCVAVGTAIDTSYKFIVQQAGNPMQVKFRATGSAARAELTVGASADAEVAIIAGHTNDAAGTLFGINRANASFFYAGTNHVSCVVGGANASCDVILAPGAAEKLRVKSGGDVVIGAGNAAATVVATGATAGFLRVSTCAGTPTGAAVDGAIVIDTTNNKLYFRSGSWRDAGP